MIIFNRMGGKTPNQAREQNIETEKYAPIYLLRWNRCTRFCSFGYHSAFRFARCLYFFANIFLFLFFICVQIVSHCVWATGRWCYFRFLRYATAHLWPAWHIELFSWMKSGMENKQTLNQQIWSWCWSIIEKINICQLIMCLANWLKGSSAAACTFN